MFESVTWNLTLIIPETQLRKLQYTVSGCICFENNTIVLLIQSNKVGKEVLRECFLSQSCLCLPVTQKQVLICIFPALPAPTLCRIYPSRAFALAFISSWAAWPCRLQPFRLFSATLPAFTAFPELGLRRVDTYRRLHGCLQPG